MVRQQKNLPDSSFRELGGHRGVLRVDPCQGMDDVKERHLLSSEDSFGEKVFIIDAP
jgi:hypothetical protein